MYKIPKEKAEFYLIMLFQESHMFQREGIGVNYTLVPLKIHRQSLLPKGSSLIVKRGWENRGSSAVHVQFRHKLTKGRGPSAVSKKPP